MKYFAILTVLVLIATLVGVGYMYMSSNIYVEAVGVGSTLAQDQPALFEELSDQVRLNAVIGTPYISTQELSGAENYKFYTYTVRLRNNCAVNAEMVEMQITPMSGDVLQIGSTANITLPAQQTADVSATILTDVNMHEIREVTITYYVWGVPFTLKATIK